VIHQLSRLLNGLIVGILSVSFMACSEDVAFNELASTDRPFSPVPPTTDEEIPPPSSDGFFTKTQAVDVRSHGGDVDILFVVDNSGSMDAEQNQLANRISGFMNIIQDLNWQVAMTTTDPSKNTNDSNFKPRNWGDGGFRPFDSDDGQHFILKNRQQSNDEAQRLLARAIHVGINGGIEERGIRSVYRAIEQRHLSSSHREFFRPGASLEVVLISDEDECSNYVCTHQDAYRSSPLNLIELVNREFGSEKKFSFHSIMWIPNDKSCKSAQNVGNTYHAMSQLSDGVVGSICSKNYSSILSDIGHKVLEQVTSIDIDCAPEDVKKPGAKPRVLITLANGDILLPHQFKLKGRKLTLQKPLPEGKHTVSYLCPQNK